MKKGGPPNKKPRYNHIYPTIVYLFIIAFEENLMACVNKWNCIFFLTGLMMKMIHRSLKMSWRYWTK